ncbi:MAG: kelch repeat-containing protein [Anaerolineae bacterium]
MITARRLHTATPLADGRILVAGGLNANNGWLASAEVYDPATGQWSSAGNLSNARYNHTTTLLADGQVLVAGMPDVSGASPLSAEVYDPAGNTWFSTTDLPATLVGAIQPRCLATAASCWQAA